jgi:hypothetical protein
MAKTRIVIDLEYHPATPALARLLSLLEWAADSYGIRSVTVTQDEVKEQ